MKSNIILIGFMGCGKTSVGKRLAANLDFHFLDTDEWIEKQEQMKITQIFETYGEEYFRQLETNTIKALLASTKNTIIATGGGLPLRECNAELIKELGAVIYLNAGKEETVRRLKGDTTRPLISGNNMREKVDTLLTVRMPKYKKAAHKEIITDNKSFDKIMEEIKEYYISFMKERVKV